MSKIDLSHYNCLALDLGGVVSADVWETIFLTPNTGLAAHYGLSPKDILKIGGEIWHRFAYSDFVQEDYWRAWDDALGYKIDRARIRDLYQKTVWTDPTAHDLIATCFDKGVDVAFVSNSTSFWYPPQVTMAQLENFVDRIDKYLSHEVGYDKTHPQGGLALLAKSRDPKGILFVDDREKNCQVGEALGMSSLYYQRKEDQALSDSFLL